MAFSEIQKMTRCLKDESDKVGVAKNLKVVPLLVIVGVDTDRRPTDKARNWYTQSILDRRARKASARSDMRSLHEAS